MHTTSFNSNHHGDLEILVQKNNPFVTTLTLNRPRKLNALSVSMLSRLYELFLGYDHDAFVKLVILNANEKAFSPGSDVASVARHLYNGNLRVAFKISETAYTLMYLVATNYNTPGFISQWDGHGDRAGQVFLVSIHGSFRVAKENMVFAMPETALGGFPDVGSSYFLSRLPGFFGEYLGLTGARSDGPEMLALGLATHLFPHLSWLC